MKNFSLKELYKYGNYMKENIEGNDGTIIRPSGVMFLKKYQCILEYIAEKFGHHTPYSMPFTQYRCVNELYDAYISALDIYYRLCYSEHPYATIQQYLYSNGFILWIGTNKRLTAKNLCDDTSFEFDDFKEFIHHEYHEIKRAALEDVYTIYQYYSEELAHFIVELKSKELNLMQLYETLTLRKDVLCQIDISNLYLLLHYKTINLLNDPYYISRIECYIKECGKNFTGEYSFPDEPFN